MNNIALGAAIVGLAGLVWVWGALIQWQNIRRQERIIGRLRRRLVRRKPKAAQTRATIDVSEVIEKPELVGEALQPANRWTVG